MGGEDGAGQRAQGTGNFETVAAQLALKSIGYKSVPVEGVAFDHRRGVVRNRCDPLHLDWHLVS